MKTNMMILILFSLTVFISCNLKRNPTFNKTLIERISKESVNYPSYYSGIMFFSKSQENRIAALNVYELREIYSKEFRQLSFKLYLTKLFNQEIAIQYNNNKEFRINEDIEKNYTSMNIDYFLNFYCKKTSKGSYTLKLNIPKSQRSTIFYFLFINNYLTCFDDIGGFYIINKIILPSS